MVDYIENYYPGGIDKNDNVFAVRTWPYLRTNSCFFIRKSKSARSRLSMRKNKIIWLNTLDYRSFVEFALKYCETLNLIRTTPLQPVLYQIALGHRITPLTQFLTFHMDRILLVFVILRFISAQGKN